jgi:hypothetical protein
MKRIIAILITLLTINVMAQVTQVTNTSLIVTKAISSNDMITIINGVNNMGIGSSVVTPSNFNQATVIPQGAGLYNVYINLSPSLYSVTNTSDTGLQYVSTKTVTTIVNPLTLNAANMQAIFDLTICQVGNMNPPITLTNFITIVVGQSTNSSGWQVTAAMINP